MKKIIAVIIFCFAMGNIIAQDSTGVQKSWGKNLTLYAGMNYSIITLESKPYFIDSTRVGYSHAKNAAGASAGLAYYIKLGKNFMLRPGVEGNFTQSRIEYDTKVTHKESSGVFPLTVETPVALIFSRNVSGGFSADRRIWPEVQLAVRPVFPMKFFNSTRPAMETFNFNIDIGVGYPIQLKNAIMRTELIFSYGLLNIIGTDETDVKTSSISYLGRSFAGLRLYFN